MLCLEQVKPLQHHIIDIIDILFVEEAQTIACQMQYIVIMEHPLV